MKEMLLRVVAVSTVAIMAGVFKVNVFVSLLMFGIVYGCGLVIGRIQQQEETNMLIGNLIEESRLRSEGYARVMEEHRRMQKELERLKGEHHA